MFSIAPAQPGQPIDDMPKQTNATVSQRRAQFIASWREFAPGVTFANLSLAQFEVETEKPLEVRSRMTAVQAQLRGMKIERDQADLAATEVFVSVANSIRGNPDFGLNSPLYRSLGYVPKSERKRAKRKPAAKAEPSAEADAA